VQFTPGPGSAEVATRLIREHQAGRPAITDLISTPVDQTVALLRADAVENVDWASWAPHLQDPQLVAPGGGAVAAVSYFPGITYNSNRLRGADAPTSLQQLLEPTYKGRIATTPYAAWFNYLGASEGWGAQRMTDYLTRFADQVSGLIRCNEKERLLTGEFDVLAIDCSHGEALLQKREGAPLDVALATDIPYVGTRYISIPRGAPHPSVAKLWVDFLLSREAQDILYDLELADNVAVPGSRSARDVEAVQGARGKLIRVDVEFYERNDEAELNRLLTLSQQMLRKQ
jgi:ABC-type Fe3+ transport system substrate-binding protein